MISKDYLLITEIGTGAHHEIFLERLRQGPITIGRAAKSDNHIQIGIGADSKNWISSCHCTLFAQRREDSPGLWDYYAHDGCQDPQGNWVPSKQHIWVGNKEISSALQLRPGFGGHVTIFPKIQGCNYYCILEWPAEKEDVDDTNPPTLQEWQLVQMERRVYKEEAGNLKQQLENLGRKMISMQDSFQMEREELRSKLNDQSSLLLGLSKSIEQEKSLNHQQQLELKERQCTEEKVKLELRRRQRAEKKIMTAMFILGLAILAIAIFMLNVDQAMIKDYAEWAALIASAVIALFGGQKLFGE